METKLKMNYLGRRVALIGAALFTLLLSACVSVGGIAESLSAAILDQQDAELVRDGAPAYLIMVDSLIANSPDETDLLLSGAKLYGAYASAFVTEPARAKLMAEKAYHYARGAACEENEKLCNVLSGDQESFNAVLAKVDDKDDLPYLFGLATAWAGKIQANADDWQAIAALPKVQALTEKVLALDETYEEGSAHLYLGGLLTLRPASLGGKPEQGRVHFERAIELSKRQNLMALVVFAESYARLVFNQELHDKLLREVIHAKAEQAGYTLINVLAKQRAQALLAGSNDYF